MKNFAIIVLALSLGGCATVTRGTTGKVTFESEPAGAEVTTTVGKGCPETPCIVEVSRKSSFVATFYKNGYQEQSIPVNTRIAGEGAAGFAGNILIGGVIGMGVDAASGSTLEHYPNPVKAELVPVRSPKLRKGRGSRSAAQVQPNS